MAPAQTKRVGGPGSGGDDKWYRHADHENDCVMFFDPTADEAIYRGEEVPVAHCTKVVCLSCNKSWLDQGVTGAFFMPKLLTADTEIVVGRIRKGTAAPPKSAPWLLGEPSPADLAEAQAYLDDDEAGF